MLSNSQNLLEVIFKIIRSSNGLNIKLVPLRYKPINLDVAFSGDYDFIISEIDLQKFLKLIFQTCTQEAINFTIVKAKFGKTQIHFYDTSSDRYITFELWNHLEVKDPANNTQRYVLWEDIESYVKETLHDGYRLEKEVEALYYISHLATKNKNVNTPEIKERIQYYHYFTEDNEIISLYDQLVKDPSELRKIAIVANTMLVTNGILFPAKNQIKSNEIKKLRLKIAIYRFWNHFYRRFKVIPLVGPDGVGKTTLIESVKSKNPKKIKYYRFKRLFRRSIIYTILHKFWEVTSCNEYAKNQIDDVYAYWIFWIAKLRFPFFLFYNLFNRKFILTDRYFHDFLFEGIRFPETVTILRKHWHDLLSSIPKTYSFIQLDAAERVILSRKQEMLKEDIVFYRENMFLFYLDTPSYIYSYINTKNTPEQCVYVIQHIIEIMAKEK